MGFLWIAVNPAVFTLVVLGFRSVASLGDSTLLPVLVSGYASMLLWRGAGSRCLSAIRSNEALLIHRNVTVQDVLIARLLLEVVGVTSSTIVLFLICISFNLADSPQNLLMMIGGWLLIVAFSFGLGFVLAALGQRSRLFDKLWSWVSLLLMPVSGMVTTVDWMPASMREIVYWFPVIHGLEIFRYGHVGDRMVPHYDIFYGVAGSIGMIVLGNAMLRTSLSQDSSD